MRDMPKRAEPGPSPWRAISLMQPLPTLACAGRLESFVLAWGTSYRGLLLLHASCSWNDGQRAVCNRDPWRSALVSLGYSRRNPLPTAGIVGVADLADCYPINIYDDEEEIDNPGPFDFRCGRCGVLRYRWRVASPRILDAAVPCVGSVGLFPVDGPLAATAFATAHALPPSGRSPIRADGTILEIMSELEFMKG
jgi:activating signal cointegrator 1